jgi:hypothetical protein
MPFANQRDFDLPVSPITMLPRGNDGSWSMSYYSEPQMGGRPGFNGLGPKEMAAFNRLPPKLVQYLMEEVEDPSFVRDYLAPALRSPNPKEKILRDIAREAYEYEEDRKHGVGGLGKKKGFFKKIAKVMRKAHAKVTPKFMRKIEGKIHKIERKVWKKYGSVIISIAGAVLAPFTGGASLVAAAVIVAAKGLYEKKQAAEAAKRMAKKDAGLISAEATAQEAKVAADVDKFYADNKAWFLQYDMTPDKWKKLTLKQKTDFIEAGVTGKLPPGLTNVTPTPDQVAAQSKQTAQAAANAGIPQSAVAPPGAPPGAGYSTSGGGAPPPQEAAAEEAAQEAQAGGTFEPIVEGRSIGTFGTLDEAYNAVLASTKPGDRFEIIANGKTMGLGVRTEDGAVEVPPEQETKMRALTPEQSQAVVAEAEKAAPKGGVPWLLILGAGAAAVAATMK